MLPNYCFLFLIYRTISSDFGCRHPHFIALRAAWRIGAYGLLKGEIHLLVRDGAASIHTIGTIGPQSQIDAESPAPVRRPSRNASLAYSSKAFS